MIGQWRGRRRKGRKMEEEQRLGEVIKMELQKPDLDPGGLGRIEYFKRFYRSYIFCRRAVCIFVY